MSYLKKEIYDLFTQTSSSGLPIFSAKSLERMIVMQCAKVMLWYFTTDGHLVILR